MWLSGCHSPGFGHRFWTRQIRCTCGLRSQLPGHHSSITQQSDNPTWMKAGLEAASAGPATGMQCKGTEVPASYTWASWGTEAWAEGTPMLAWDSKLSRGATGTRVLIPAADAAVTSSFNEAATHVGSLPPASPHYTHRCMLSLAADAQFCFAL